MADTILCSFLIGSEYAKQYIVPEAGARAVDPKVQAGLETAKWVSTGACKVSGEDINSVVVTTLEPPW